MGSHSQRQGGAVLGSPIAHSLSPVLHQAAYDALGLTGWTYRAIECPEADLGSTLEALDREGLVGASLTMPLKRAVMPMLAASDDVAGLVGGANTVRFDDRGWLGSNTDVPGMVAALRPEIAGIGEGPSACVLGAGATAAAAIAAVAQLGFSRVEVVARRPEQVAALVELATAVNVGLAARAWDDAAAALAAPVVISTTPAAAAADLKDSIPGQLGVLFDVIYAPWPTPLATAWTAAAGRVIGGLELLVEQAALQVELMTGREAPVTAMREAGYAALARRA